MSLNRPKRRATINKSYNDTLDESVFEEIDSKTTRSSSSSSLAAKRKSSSANSLKRASLTDLLYKDKKLLPYNWQPLPSQNDFFSFHLDLQDAYVDTLSQTLYCPHQEVLPAYARSKRRKSKEIFLLRKGDYLYMVSEPPGEPYYIGRIMGFKNKRHDRHSSEDQDVESNVDPENDYKPATDYLFQIQWFYRPRDISKSTSDSRLLYASMHTDTCPLQSFRGLVTVKHKQEVEDEFNQSSPTPPPSHLSKNGKKLGTSPSNMTALEAYSQYPNCFYFDKLFDRYMIKFYDIIPTASLLPYAENESNNSKSFIVALNKRFEFIFMEAQRTKAFMNSFSSTESCHCEECGQWCSTSDSVNCASCHKFYHMLCLNPPLMKKPSRGFSWSCAPCNKKHEIEYQSKRLLMLSNDNKSSNEKELSVELNALSNSTSDIPSSATPESNLGYTETSTDSNDDEQSTQGSFLPKYEIIAQEFLKKDENLTFEERRLLEEWNMRYLGMHSRLEDGVDIDDRSPYPRASTRLGTKHQATNIPEYEDHPIVYYDTDKSLSMASSSSSNSNKKKSNKKKKIDEEKDTVKLPVPEEYQELSPKDFPQWLQPRPKGYIERGVDDGEGITATLLWKPREEDQQDNFEKLDAYVERCSPIAEKLNLLATSPNFMDAILKYYFVNDGDAEKAFEESSKLTRASLKEPTFSKQEVEKFEAGVKKYGSELYPTFKEVKTQSCAMIVRFYYLWKKTKNGRLIWGNFPGRIHKKLQNVVKDEVKSEDTAKKAIDTLVDTNDDSAYESNKLSTSGKVFGCKHCHTLQSTQWFRITGYDTKTKIDISKEENRDFVDCDAIGLCLRCARLWRRYAVVWEDPNEVQKKTTKSVGGWKKKTEAELVMDSETILNQAEQEGAVLTYDLAEINQEYVGDKVKKTSPSPAKRSHSKVELSKKAPVVIKKEEATTAPAPKRKKPTPVKELKQTKSKVNGEATKSVKKVDSPKVKTEVKKSGRSLKTEDSKSKRKRSETSTPVKSEDGVLIKSEEFDEFDSLAPSNKKQRGSGAENGKVPKKCGDVLINPIFNKNYLLPRNEIMLDKKYLPPNNREALHKILSCHRIKQLADLHPQVHPYQLPNQSKLKLPFDTDERNCSICLDYDSSESSSNEMLICANCGVNVHTSCSRISVPPNVPLPIKEWLCSACINDLNTYHTTLYSCCLCLAKDSNHELSMFGSPLVKPDYLKPINDSGKWCHLLCALFNHNQVTFRQMNVVPQQKKLTRDEMSDQKVIIESTHNTLSIESVSEAYLRSYTSRCGICHSLNGSLLPCELCDESSGRKRYHVTCAQDTPNFKLGFKLVQQKSSSKENSNVTIGSESGKLKPVLLCPKHDHVRSGIHSMRALGRRSTGNTKDELKPLILLFIDDIIKSTTTTNRLSGPQFKAHNYIHMIKIFSEEEAIRKIKFSNMLNPPSDSIHSSEKSCLKCKTRASPMWWIQQKQEGKASYNFVCQSCYHNRDSDENEPQSETQKLREILHEPLDGSSYGLTGEHDRLSDVYNINQVSLTQVKPLEPVRSRISIGDILS